jgi:pimeloyl-ACP methyl ester carboxylesterase
MGFLASWRSAREVVLPSLKAVRAKHPAYPIHLVGHSLGGAVAALAALELKLSLGWDDVTVTTFGEPRVGNEDLASYLDVAFGLDHDDGYDPDLEGRRYRRVTHVKDPVPLLPPSEWGYRSHAGEIYISKTDLQPGPEDLRFCRGDSDPRCIAGKEKSDRLGLFRSMRGGEETEAEMASWLEGLGFPGRLKLWQLFFAHRDYFWRLGLCVPGGDPWDWGRDRFNHPSSGSFP